MDGLEQNRAQINDGSLERRSCSGNDAAATRAAVSVLVDGREGGDILLADDAAAAGASVAVLVGGREDDVLDLLGNGGGGERVHWGRMSVDDRGFEMASGVVVFGVGKCWKGVRLLYLEAGGIARPKIDETLNKAHRSLLPTINLKRDHANNKRLRNLIGTTDEQNILIIFIDHVYGHNKRLRNLIGTTNELEFEDGASEQKTEIDLIGKTKPSGTSETLIPLYATVTSDTTTDKVVRHFKISPRPDGNGLQLMKILWEVIIGCRDS
ncbi:hypothetical protein K438DRAFT_1762013 [Mycena galopus ATCC 62051]|nr:hypothetical protein K438DRAFT_1762013 [Mycena galopus ATCC 62051]